MSKPKQPIWDVTLDMDDDPEPSMYKTRTRFTWSGRAKSREDAVAKARMAYPDQTCRYHLRDINCRLSLPDPDDKFGGL